MQMINHTMNNHSLPGDLALNCNNERSRSPSTVVKRRSGAGSLIKMWQPMFFIKKVIDWDYGSQNRIIFFRKILVRVRRDRRPRRSEQHNNIELTKFRSCIYNLLIKYTAIIQMGPDRRGRRSLRTRYIIIQKKLTTLSWFNTNWGCITFFIETATILTFEYSRS